MNNLILAAASFLLTLLSEILFNTVQNIESLIPLEKYFGFFIFLILITFIKNKKIRLGFLLFIPVLSYFQMLHISFYGMPVYPNAIYLMFTEVSEIFGTLKEEISLFLIPSLIISPSLALIIYANHKIKSLRSIPYFQFLFFFYLIYNPARTYLTGNTWGRQPSTQEMMGMNIYLSSSYFFGRILPAKLSKKVTDHSKQTFQLSKTQSFEGNIILILGESLSANHLSILGQKRITTPFLDSLKDSPQFFYTKGISSGVSTDVAVAFFMNNTFGLNGQQEVFSGKKCLFKLAKDNGFQTSFFSSQSQQQLRYITNSICQNSIDNYKNLDELDPKIEDPNAADDLILIPELEKSVTKGNQFIVLHQRGSHAPYNLRYPKKSPQFQLTGDYHKDRINHYHNSVFEFDKFMRQAIKLVQKTDIPTVLLYISDHGEGLGEEGVWGHAALKKPSFSIPVLIYSHQTQKRTLSKTPTHLEASLLISSLLGYKANIELPPTSYQVFGNDMDGFAGYLDLKLKNGEIIKAERKDI